MGNDLQIGDFKNYFSGLWNDIFSVKNDLAEYFCENHRFDVCNDYCYSDLDRPISLDELYNGVKTLNRGKAYGPDCLLNEYFIESMDIIGAHVCDIFNCILDSGFFPESWMDGIIVPLFKKGDVNNVHNYRGITLVSCLSKLFTSVLNKRIEKFCNENNTITDAQFAFVKGRSTVDAMFILLSIIQSCLNDKKRLYCSFVDFTKAFDSVYRNALWLKLYKCGIGGKCLRIIKDMYSKVKSCVRLHGGLTDSFEIPVGLKQGEIMSPLLWALFLEDLELFLQGDFNSGIQIDELEIILLLFADDLVIFGNSPKDLQNSLNKLYEYCQTWGLEVNTQKTKVMVFRKKGKILPNECFTYNNIVLENVDHFNYLGTVFSYTGNFCNNQEQITGKALKALNVLLTNCSKYKMKPKILCQLFDSFVGSILSYAAPIWGYTKSKSIERIHMKFCKRILNVRQSTCNAVVYAELGRYPLFINRYVQILKYWFKLKSTENIILKTVYRLSHEQCEKGCRNWVSDVKSMLNEHGFSNIWENPFSVNGKNFVQYFRQRLIDNYTQSCFSLIANASSLQVYKYLKDTLQYEIYLDILPPDLRFFITRLRTSSHSLRIQTCRFSEKRIPRNERVCLLCTSGETEDEFHFVLKCPFFDQLRKKYIKEYYHIRPSTYKLLELLNSTNKNEIFNLADYVKNALFERTSYTYQLTAD